MKFPLWKQFQGRLLNHIHIIWFVQLWRALFHTQAPAYLQGVCVCDSSVIFWLAFEYDLEYFKMLEIQPLCIYNYIVWFMMFFWGT